MLNKSSIILLMLAGNLALAQSAKVDSLKTTVFNNHVYFIHTVENGQTLFSLARKYNCTLDQIKSWNPVLKANSGIVVGQELVFPIIRYGKHIVAAVTQSEVKKMNRQLIEDDKKTELAIKSGKEHIVEPGETLYSISKNFNVKSDDLEIANKIYNGKIEAGQKLLVDKNEIAKLLKATNPIIEKKELPKLPVNGLKIAEEGVAEVINTSNRSAKSLALHRSAPIGSVIQVINEANGMKIMAKVVGNISSDGPDQDILVKLSPSAYRRLSPKDSKMRAKVVYFTQNYGIL